MAAERVLRYRFSYKEEWEMRKLDKEFALEPVPQKYRNGFWQMLAVMIELMLLSASRLSVEELAIGLNLVKFVLIDRIDNLMLGLYTVALAYIAANTGLYTNLLAGYVFGKKGSYLPSFLL